MIRNKGVMMQRKVLKLALCILMFTTVLVINITINVNAPFKDEEWVARYNGPRDRYDTAMDIITDSNGNVYVTGWSDFNSNSESSQMEYATVAYAPSGDELWSARFSGSINSNDHACAIALSPNGNIIVTGDANWNGTKSDYTTVAYSFTGTQLWVARYDSPLNDRDEAKALAVDKNGYIFVTGYSYGGNPNQGGSDWDYATVAYDSNGAELWATRFNGLGDSYDFASAIALDDSGNVYVTGRSIGYSGNFDYATVAYNSSGKELWVARYNGPDSRQDYPTGIATDGQGNIYVTGWSNYNNTHKDYTTIKYNSTGKEVWVARYDGPGNKTDEPYSIALDSLGNIFVTGFSCGNVTGLDYATIKYDKNGNLIWVTRYNGPGNKTDWAFDIAFDLYGNTFVTGRSHGGHIDEGGTDMDYATIAYDSFGNEIWVARYNGPGNGQDWASSIATDNFGNVFVTGQSWGGYSSQGGSDMDYATVKYSAYQDPLYQNPVADAGCDQTVLKGEIVQFNGTESFSPNGDIDVYEWDFDANVDSNSDGNFTNDVDATGPIPNHVYSEEGVYTVTLTVTDNLGLFDSDSCIITVLNPAMLPPILYIEIDDNQEDVILYWDPPSVPEIDYYLIYRSTSQIDFDFNDIWINTSLDLEPGESNPIPLRTMWNDTNAGNPNIRSFNKEYYYAIRAVNSYGEVSSTSRTVGKWTKIFSKGISTFSLPLEPIKNLYIHNLTVKMKADYIKFINSSSGTWMQYDSKKDTNSNKLMKPGEGYEVKFPYQTQYTFCGLPAAMINYHNQNEFFGFFSANEAKTLDVTKEYNGDVILTWQEPQSMAPGDYYEVYYSNSRDGFFGTYETDYFLVNNKIYFGNSTTTHIDAHATNPNSRLYYMVVPFNFSGIRGSSTYSIGIWTEDYNLGYDSFGIPMKLDSYNTVDWYCDNIFNTVGINYYDINTQCWNWHSTNMPQGAYDPQMEMAVGYQISTNSNTKFTFIGK